jgi:hypothetical protein
VGRSSDDYAIDVPVANRFLPDSRRSKRGPAMITLPKGTPGPSGTPLTLSLRNPIRSDWRRRRPPGSSPGGLMGASCSPAERMMMQMVGALADYLKHATLWERTKAGLEAARRGRIHRQAPAQAEPSAAGRDHPHALQKRQDGGRGRTPVQRPSVHDLATPGPDAHSGGRKHAKQRTSRRQTRSVQS